MLPQPSSRRHPVHWRITWHESQKLTPQKDGSMAAEFQLSDTEEIKRWIMSFGQHAVVLEPDALRAEIVQELNSLLAAYRQGSGTSGPSPSHAPASHPNPRPPR